MVYLHVNLFTQNPILISHSDVLCTMKLKNILFLTLNFLFLDATFGQKETKQLLADTNAFNYSYWNGVADEGNLTTEEKAGLISVQKKIFKEEQLHQHLNSKDLVWVSEPVSSQKGYSQNTTNAGTCSNVDFETGTFSGWTRSTGYNPLTNSIGCCSSPNGDQTIMSGSGTDPYGGFPVVYPGSGSYSLRLGSTAIGGLADRVSQTIFVTSSNVNFTYYYALVLNDGGHVVSNQPRFLLEVIDTLGNPIPNYTYLNTQPQSQAISYITSSLTANGAPVLYKNWAPVTIDLSQNIGQNVTIQFTAYDCSPTGHFAYAYIDGSCGGFLTSSSQTVCQSSPLCIPGFSTGTWNGPGITNEQTTCITPTLAGTYSCSSIMMSGYPGPIFTYSVSTADGPTVSISSNNTGSCVTQYSFSGSSTISSGSITSHVWSFGDGSTSTVFPNVAHTYTNPGIYQVTLKAFSSNGCSDSAIVVVNFTQSPIPNFTTYGACADSVVLFMNSSTILSGSITGYTWAFGDGGTSTLANPAHTYTSSGVFSVSLQAMSNQGCTATLTKTVSMFPAPAVNFTSNVACPTNATFFPLVSIASGSVISYAWEFGDLSVSTQSNPVHSYSSVGMYTVTLKATSDHGCYTKISGLQTAAPLPNLAFTSAFTNSCSQTYAFQNTSSISLGSVSFTWNFGGTNSSTLTSPTYTFPGAGTYTVNLTGTSDYGCTSTSMQTISILPAPSASFTTTNICQNSSITVSAISGTMAINAYNWDFGDPGSGTNNTVTGQSFWHNYTTAGNYTITLNLSGNWNCSSVVTKTLTVYPNPTVSVNSGSICTGNTFTFSPTGGTTYSYPANSNTVSPVMNTSYSITGISAFGCSNTAVSSVFVYTTPTISIANGTICSGNSFMLTPAGSYSYIFPAGSAIVNPTLTSSYIVSGVSLEGCPSANTVTCVVTVNPKPAVSVNSASICSGNTFTMIPSGASSYTFSNGTGIVSPTSTTSYSIVGASAAGCTNIAVSHITVYITPTITVNSGTTCSGKSFTLVPNGASTYSYSSGNAVVTPASTTSYTVTGISSMGCANTAVSTVTVYTTPTIVVNSGAICTGNTFTLSPSGATNYTYSGGSAVVSPTSTTSYTITGKSPQGCLNSNSAVSTVTVNDLPTISVISTNNSMCAGESTTLIASGASSYTWQTITPASFAIVHPTISTTYTVLGTDANNCSNTTLFTQNVSLCTGLATLNQQKDIYLSVYPNPNSGVFTIRSDRDIDLSIINALGQIVKYISLDDSNDHTLSISEVAEGVYFIISSGNAVRINQKIIVTK